MHHGTVLHKVINNAHYWLVDFVLYFESSLASASLQHFQNGETRAAFSSQQGAVRGCAAKF